MRHLIYAVLFGAALAGSLIVTTAHMLNGVIAA